MGKPDPDIVANGRMSFGSTPLNQVLFAPEYNGTRASELWAGTSLSAPTVSGILALVYEAYYKAEHLIVNETLINFVSVGGDNVTELTHAPIRAGSFTLYENGTLIPVSNYTLDIANGSLTLFGELNSSKVITATYRFYDDYPDSATARRILMSTADDIKFDVLSQGAGFTNAERATLIANNLSGIEVSPNMWTPGDYKGEKYESFVSFMKPGTYENKAFTVTNANPTSTVNLNITDKVFRKMAEVNYTVTTALDGNGEPLPYWSFILVNNLAKQEVTSPGVYNMNNISIGIKNKLADINETIWLNTELLKISAVTNQSNLDPELDGNLEHNYWLDIYDWTLVCPSLPCEYDPELELTGSKDLNRMNMDNPTSNVLEVRVHNPAQRIHDALGIALRPVLKGDKDIDFRVTLEFYNRTDWNWLDVDSQLTVGGSSTPDGIKSFDANISVPVGTPIGSYQGGIYIYGNETNANETMWGRTEYPEEYMKLVHDNIIRAKVYRNTTLLTEGVNYTLHRGTGVIQLFQNVTAVTSITADYWYADATTIPVLINVPVETVDFDFGNNAPGQDEFFKNSIIGGFGGGGQSGDWRFYFVDLPNQGLFAGEDMKFHLNISWDYNLTDVDAFSFGEGGSNPAGVQYPANRYGPILLMENKGGSEETGAFYTTTNSNREIIFPPLTGGLNIIALHNVKMSGITHRESISGQVGMARVQPSEFKIVSNRLADSRDVKIYSSRELQGLNGVAAGPSAPERIVNITINQDDVASISNNDDFLKALADGSYTKKVTVQKSALIFGANITSLAEYVERPCVDLDLGVFLDGKGPDNVPDGKATDVELVTYDADPDAEERVKIIKPTVEDDPDTPGIDESATGAPYIIKVLGFDTGGQCLFNMDINLVQGEGFTVEGITEEMIPPFTTSSIGVSWNLPSDTQDGEFMGAFYIGPFNAPMALLIPIEITIEHVLPEIFNFEITSDKEVNYLDNITTNDPTPMISVYVSDDSRGELDWQSVKVYLNDTDITHLSQIDIPFVDPDGRNGPLEFGYWDGVIAYTPSKSLPDGAYVMRYEVKDQAGNLAIDEFIFIIDTMAPPLDDGLIMPQENHSTSLSTVMLSGITEPFARVKVRTTNLTADDTGYFSIFLDLEPGINDIAITAIDWFGMDFIGNLVHGNAISRTRRIINDVMAPTITSVSNSTGSPTNKDFTLVKGFVHEYIGNETTNDKWDPTTVELRIGGVEAMVQTNGLFSAMVELREGQNTIVIEALDRAGNKATRFLNIVKDVTPPTTSIKSLPSEVSSSVITIEGTAEPGSTVLVNGRYVPNTDGSFSLEIALVAGLNEITIEVIDDAGNVKTMTQSVEYSPVTTISSYYLIPLFILMFILVFLIGVKFGAQRLQERKEEPEGEGIEEDEGLKDEEVLGDEGRAEDEPEEKGTDNATTEEESGKEEKDLKDRETPKEND
jgi:hypothetical protein